MSKPNSEQAKLTEALALGGYYLWELGDEEKARLALGNRKGKVFQIVDENGKRLCTYSTLAQVKRFLSKKIGD
jgi:hypothetical protein